MQHIRRKTIAILTLVVVATGIAALSASAVSAKPAAKKLMVIITPSHTNPFFASIAQISNAEAKKLGYATLVLSHNDDPNLQSQQIDLAISRHASRSASRSSRARAKPAPPRGHTGLRPAP